MTILRPILVLAIAAALFAQSPALPAQQSFTASFRSHNAAMASLQPVMAGMLMTPNPRLSQSMRFSFSHERTSVGTGTESYGDGHGVGVLVGKHLELDAVQPPYVRHSNGTGDGFGDASIGGKFRIASGNPEHGNFIVTAILNERFATGSHKNGAATNSYSPTLAGGLAFNRLAVISTLGGSLPTGKIAEQGRSITWNAVMEGHATRHLWLEVENNATYYLAGRRDGLMQNFITPSAFYSARRKEWEPTHPYTVFALGMQIATSEFHTYNHHLGAEMRLVF
jgi:hypothetical protein